MFQKMSRIFIAVLAIAGLGACSLTAPKPTLSVQHEQTLRDAGATPVKLGQFSAQGNDAHDQSITLRGSSMHSPYGSYSKYLQEAVAQELKEAGLLDSNAKIEIVATLQKNDIHAAGFVTASADIEVRFVVKHADKIVYDQIKSAHIEWGSNFIGAIAIPRAQESYPRLVAALLDTLYADSAFLAALKA